MFVSRGNPGGAQTLEQGRKSLTFLLILYAGHSGSPAEMQAAERDINDMTDAVYGYLQTAKNKPLWTNIDFPELFQRLHHQDLPQAYLRAVPFRVYVK